MSTTSSNVGHQELAECPSDQTPLHNSCHNQVLPNGNEESVLELKQDETPERTIKNQDQAKCNNHIQKNSYQQLFMDESDSQNHSDTGVHKVVALSQLASNVLSSTTQQDTAVPSSSAGVGHNSPTTHINHSIKPKRESQPRDFPHLPLVDNLFTANIIDDIIGGAMQEIKQQRLLNGPDVETEDKEDPLEFSKMVDEITRGVDGLTDNINRHSDVSISDVSSICLDDIPLDDSISSDPGERYTQENLMTGSMAPPSDVEAVQEEDLSENTLAYENTQGSGIMAMDNDWSQCNGYAEDEEDTRPTERELVTEIVFISETSFMDEETQQHYDPENTALTFETELNPDAPEFIPCAGFPISSDPTDNTSEVPDEMAIEEKKNDDSSNRYSDFEDRVDVSDSSDEILKSPSFKQFSLPNDANNSSSIIDSSVKTQEKTQPNEENLSIFSDTLVTKCETDNNLENVVDINAIPVISKEKQKTVIFGGDLFEDIDLDNTGNFSLLDDVFTSKDSKSQKTTQNEYLTQPSIVDAFCNDDMNFSDEEYVGERYMDHQQIYDPSKYKDYYQICSALDVPDSPMDIISQEKILNNLKSSTINSSPKVVTRDIAIVKPQEHHVKPDIKIEEDDDIPSALRSRIAEIVLHETDDISDCGSEDVETIGHRYETADQPNHAYVNQLSLAAEMLRTKQELPYDDQFKPVMGADGVPMVATLNHGTVLGTPSLHPRHHYYGNPCFEMEDVPPVRSKEVADSGVQSEESTDESEDCRRQWNNAQADDNSPNKASFGYKKFGTKSKPLSAMLKGKTDPLCLCCEIM